MAQQFVRSKSRGAFSALIKQLPAKWQSPVSSLLESIVFREELSQSIRGSSSAIDHGTTQGLNDDDHVSYHNDIRALAWLGTTDITDHATYDHTSLTTIGTNTHGQVDTHIADETIHFVRPPVVESAVSRGAQSSPEIAVMDATSGDLTYTLPSLTGRNGFVYEVKKSDATANTVTVVGTIDNDANFILLSQDECVTVKGGTSTWWITT